MNYSVKGKLKRYGSVETVGANNFTKREFVIETQEQYPQSLSFQLTKDRVDIIEVYSVGEEMEVHFNLRGRDWTNPQGETKTFNQLECWKLVRLASAAPVEQNDSMDMNNDYQQPQGKDDLQF